MVPRLHIGYVRETTSDESFPFGLDQVERYRGESFSAFGLKAGARVEFELDQDDRVMRLRLLAAGKAKAARGAI